jgi:hypothetical protein
VRLLFAKEEEWTKREWPRPDARQGPMLDMRG